MESIVIISLVLLIINILIGIFCIIRISGVSGNSLPDKSLSDLQTNFKEDFSQNRKELNDNLSVTRQEINKTLNEMRNTEYKQLSSFTDTYISTEKSNRDEITKTLNTFENKLNTSIEKIRETLEKKIKDLQLDNNQKLEEMRHTVDEKLEKTLDQRLGQSFKQVSDRLEQVHKGLGEMQTLASGVGDLKKVLANVKTRGIVGEHQLANILEQILTPEQYGKNIKTKVGSNAFVEFAVKLPGRSYNNKTLWLPVDSKCPTEDYQSLINSYEAGITDQIDINIKKLAVSIKKCAQDIRDKYLDPPNTTDFGIMFLPFEGLYAEVLRSPGLFESLQREYKVIVTGPSTLSAFLNSLQMGFRTLAIEKRSSEVWDLLRDVKKDFGMFGLILSKTKEKLDQASSSIDKASVRTREIERKLQDVQVLPQSEIPGLIKPNITETLEFKNGEEQND